MKIFVQIMLQITGTHDDPGRGALTNGLWETSNFYCCIRNSNFHLSFQGQLKKKTVEKNV